MADGSSGIEKASKGPISEDREVDRIIDALGAMKKSLHRLGKNRYNNGDLSAAEDICRLEAGRAELHSNCLRALAAHAGTDGQTKKRE